MTALRPSMSVPDAASCKYLYSFYNNFLVSLKLDKFKNIYIFLNKKWFFDKLYNELIAQNFINFSFKVSYKNIDKGILELLGPKGISENIYKLSILFSFLQNSLMTFYAFIIIFALIFFIFIFSSNILNIGLIFILFIYLIYNKSY